jgi:hypothetical protein
MNIIGITISLVVQLLLLDDKPRPLSMQQRRGIKFGPPLELVRGAESTKRYPNVRPSPYSEVSPEVRRSAEGCQTISSRGPCSRPWLSLKIANRKTVSNMKFKTVQQTLRHTLSGTHTYRLQVVDKTRGDHSAAPCCMPPRSAPSSACQHASSSRSPRSPHPSPSRPKVLP